jgi:hypothetical protein
MACISITSRKYNEKKSTYHNNKMFKVLWGENAWDLYPENCKTFYEWYLKIRK